MTTTPDPLAIARTEPRNWNEADSARRQEKVGADWAANATYLDPLMRGEGREGDRPRSACPWKVVRPEVGCRAGWRRKDAPEEAQAGGGRREAAGWVDVTRVERTWRQEGLQGRTQAAQEGPALDQRRVLHPSAPRTSDPRLVLRRHREPNP